MKFFLLNAQFFATVKYELSTLTSDYNIDILCLNETLENKNSNIPLSLPNYRCFRVPGLQTLREEWQFSSNKI